MVAITEPLLPLLVIEFFLKRYPTEKRRARMRPHYQAMLTEVRRLSIHRAIYDEFSLDKLPDLAALFPAEAVSAVLAVCTLGMALDEYGRELVQADMMLAAIFEEVALAAMVSLTRMVHGQIRAEMQERGLKAGPAYRPGIGRWPLTAQQSIFSLLPAHRIQVSLNDVAVMTPKMSTSLIIPILDRRQR
jgi:hypothetical protein